MVAGQTTLDTHESGNKDPSTGSGGGGSRHHHQQQQVIHAKRLIVHPDYNGRSLRNDIGIIKLERALHLNDKVKRVKLPKHDFLAPSGTMVTVAGWGSAQVKL